MAETHALHLAADKLGQRFGGLVLFRQLSFSLQGGQSLAVTGANGSGKSTLLKIIAGVLRPTRGQVGLRLGGTSVTDEERPLHTGMVAPYMNLYDEFSARENLTFLARVRRLGEAAHRVRSVLDEVGLSARADDQVSTFSSGMKQRVKYAAALLSEPPLLLLDEPTSNLDARGLAMVRRVQQRQRDRGRLLIVATNRPEEARRHTRQLSVEDYP